MYRYLMLITFFLALVLTNCYGESKRPVLRWGAKGRLDLKAYENGYEGLYPAALGDSLYFSLKQRFSPLFTLAYMMEFSYLSINMYTDNPSELYRLGYKSSLGLLFKINNSNALTIKSRHGFDYRGGKLIYSSANSVGYRLKLDCIDFSAAYTGTFAAGRPTLLSHRLGVSLYWTVPGKEYLKYRATLKTSLNHGPSGELSLSSLKGGSLSFELILDLNRLKLADFCTNEEDERDRM